MKYYILLAVVLVLLLTTIFICGEVRNFEKIGHSQVFEKGTKLFVDSIILYNIREDKDTLVKLRGIRLLNFWASWCRPCIEEMPTLQKLQHDYPTININLISFEDRVSQKKILAARSINLSAFQISDTSTFKVPKLLPRTIILKDNIVVNDMYTARDWTSKEIKSMIDSLVSNDNRGF